MGTFLARYLLIVLIIFGFFTFRNIYTYNCFKKTGILIYRYTEYLLNSNQYNMNADYYNKMRIDYDKHLLSIWLWGKYSVIKPEYKKLLSSFDWIKTDKGDLK